MLTTTTAPGMTAQTYNTLSNIIKPKFNRYMAFTSNLVRCVPSIPNRWFTYPNDSMISDLMVFCSLYIDVYEAFCDGKYINRLIEFISADSYALSLFSEIIEGEGDGSFWHFEIDPPGPLSPAQATGNYLEAVLRTMRNGFAHMHWFYRDLSALEYWNAMGWETANAEPAFNLHGRPANNYMTYIADALPPWLPDKFWSLNKLRIIVTRSTALRYHLHLFLNYLLNGKKENIFSVH